MLNVLLAVDDPGVRSIDSHEPEVDEVPLRGPGVRDPLPVGRDPGADRELRGFTPGSLRCENALLSGSEARTISVSGRTPAGSASTGTSSACPRVPTPSSTRPGSQASRRSRWRATTTNSSSGTTSSKATASTLPSRTDRSGWCATPSARDSGRRPGRRSCGTIFYAGAPTRGSTKDPTWPAGSTP
jgi:hypothetical protein